MSKELIIDLGMHKCEDSSFYLHKGYKLVSVDADPLLIESAKNRFRQQFDSGDFVLLNNAVSDVDGEEVNFFISEKTLWNSLNENISSRSAESKRKICVKTIKLSTIIKQYGAPYYCKIDIEGFDEKAVATLSEIDARPRYISVETECLGSDQVIDEKEALKTLDRLKDAGYTKFKLIDQMSLRALTPCKTFYTCGYVHKMRQIYWNYQAKLGFNLGLSKREKFNKQFGWKFVQGASGPFGEETDGQWYDYNTARSILVKHRADYFKLPFAVNYGFWCDWHATM